MPTHTSFQISTVSDSNSPTNTLDVLTNVRQEWELVAEGKSLLQCEGLVVLLLFDIVTKLDVPVDEQRHLLGPALFDEAPNYVTRQN